MDEQFDKDLKKRIQEVFGEVDDTAADDGWLLLREKFPEKQSRLRPLAWLWWGSVAAVLLIFMGLGLWIYNQNIQTGNSTSKIAHRSRQHKTDSIGQQSITKNNIADKAAESPQIDKAATVEPDKHNVTKRALRSSANIQQLAANKDPNSKSVTNYSGFHQDKHSKNSPGTILPPTKTILPALDQQIVASKKSKDTGNLDAKNDQQSQIAAVGTANAGGSDQIPNSPAKPPKSINDLFGADKQSDQSKKSYSTGDEEKKIHFGVYAATFFNYAKGSNKQVNVGAGFSSDIKLSRNLKFVTGVSIAQNTLGYNNAVSTITSSGALAVSPTSSAHKTPVVPSASANYFAAGYAAVATPDIKNYNATLIGLDIPLNLKFDFNPNRSETYILAGLSSGTFINEQYAYSYNYPTVNSTSLQQTQNSTSSKSFDNFYFAKTLNFAFGVGYPMGKNHLVIEPFLKYPLQGLGAQQIKFGAGGINLKFNFLPKKIQTGN